MGSDRSSLVRSDEIVVDMMALQDWGVHPLEASHDLLSVTGFPVRPFHLVVVDRIRWFHSPVKLSKAPTVNWDDDEPTDYHNPEELGFYTGQRLSHLY